MQRKFLEELGLEKEVIDKIMSENGKDIESSKHRIEAERDNYKTQLETAQAALKEFEGVDVKELNGKISQLTADLSAKESEYQAKIADMEFNSVLEAAIGGAKAKNADFVKAVLDIDTLKSSKNQSEDIKAAIAKAKSEYSYIFESSEPVNNPVAPGNVPEPGKGKMTLIEAMAYKNAHPDADVNSLI